ncbi:MAG: NADH-quinone oxidoreductase subunit J [Verrucomicrobiota bacterium]|jgi:NADH-quinone oxidoreductase subunit J|nr:NADH-quinone oxidoreductase subunit J [Chthoniobacteraceae bacterium]NBV33193.1 NADH-quinone oxidoreductase subunit J [Pseudomonadota bacterium]
MSPILFWIFTALMLAFGTSVVLNRDPVASALSLVASFLCLSALFVGLDAFFIGVIQILVYAGAVMVLFLFIIMLLDLKAEKRRHFNRLTLVGGGAVAAGFVFELLHVLNSFSMGKNPFPPLGVARLDDVRQVGITLFTQFNLPFQTVGVLVLVASVGVIVLSRRELK